MNAVNNAYRSNTELYVQSQNANTMSKETGTSDNQISPERKYDTFSLSDNTLQTAVTYTAQAASRASATSYNGETLYNTLNGKTVYVSYTGGSQNNAVTINLTKGQFSAMAGMCNMTGIEPSTVLAIMAHESGFNPDAYNSSGACGLMQVLEQYYEPNLTRYNNVYYVAKTAAGIGDRIKDDPFNPYGNMAAGISSLKYWKDYYGEEDMIKAYAQGFKGDGWSRYAINCDLEIRDIKSQIDNML